MHHKFCLKHPSNKWLIYCLLAWGRHQTGFLITIFLKFHSVHDKIIYFLKQQNIKLWLNCDLNFFSWKSWHQPIDSDVRWH